MNVTAIIFARGGSKGLPGKNIRPLNGKPLIAWSIEQALSVKQINNVIVSTDSEDIAKVARYYGAQVPFIRPKELSQDDSPEWLAWQHALNYIKETNGALPDVMVSVPTTSPLRLPYDIEQCLAEFNKGGADIVITVTEANRNPYFNMVKTNEDGTVGLVIPPSSAIARRQDAPVVYDMATVAYVIQPKFVMSHNSLFEGRIRAITIPRERAIDIDTLYDFHLAECLLNSRENKL